MIEGCAAARGPPDVFAGKGHGLEYPQRGLDSQPPRTTQLLVDIVAERAALVHVAVGKEIFAPRHAAVEGEEHGLHHIVNIDKGDVLPLVAHAEIDMPLDAFDHEKVVFLTRSVHAGGPQHDVVEVVADGVEKLLGLEFALAIEGVGARGVGLLDLLIGSLLADGTEHAERTEVDEAFQGHAQLEDGMYKIDRSLIVHLEKIVGMDALGHPGSMHDIVEIVAAELLGKPLLGRKIKFDEMDTMVLQILSRTAPAHCCPCFKPLAQCLLHDKTANETAGTGDEYRHNYQVTKLLHFR